MKIGDKVRFLNDVGGGTILRIEGKTAYVADSDGFEIPTNIADLLVIEGIKQNNFPANAAPPSDSQIANQESHVAGQDSHVENRRSQVAS